MLDKKIKNFKNGRKLQELVNQIEQIHIILSESKNSGMNKILKENLKNIFPKYTILAEEYGVSKREIEDMKEIYKIYAK